MTRRFWTMLNLRLHGALVALCSLVLVVACGTASESQTPERSGGPRQSDDAVVATVGERDITLADVDAKLRQTNMSVFQELYNARRAVLGELVAEMLLAEEAAARGVTTEELVAEEITARAAPVTDEDVEAFYEQNRARLGGQTFEQIGGQIREFMVARSEQAARQAFIDGLRDDADVAIDLEAPRVPIQVASNERVKGPEDAQVTIVEYSDFQ
jgi:hypothetical protein